VATLSAYIPSRAGHCECFPAESYFDVPGTAQQNHLFKTKLLNHSRREKGDYPCQDINQSKFY
jgi:hypothetical protein